MASRQRDCYIGIITTYVVATAALGFRLYARRLMGLRLALDDYLCIVAYTFALVSSAVMLEWTWYGLGLLLRDVRRPPEVIFKDSLLRLWVLEFTYAYSLGFSKLSILTLYWRCFGLFRVRIPIIVLLVATLLWLLCRTFLGLFHCIPPQAFWRMIPDARCPIDDTKFEFGTVVVHVFLDVAILTIPVIGLGELTFRTMSQRLGILAMFLSGALVCVVSMVNLTQLYAFLRYGASKEILWGTAPPALWGTIEINMAILAISLPLMRPIAAKIFLILLPAHARNATSPATQHGWVHVEWLRRITSTTKSLGTTATSRRPTIEDLELVMPHRLEGRAPSLEQGESHGSLSRVASQRSEPGPIPVSGFTVIRNEHTGNEGR